MVSPRKSFFQSLDKDERDALLKIAPSLRCATTGFDGDLDMCRFLI